MDPEKLKRLEAAGWAVTTVAEFLGLTTVESEIIEFRLALARAVREGREARGMTRKQFAKAIRSRLSRVSEIESAVSDVSVTTMIEALFAVGRRVEIRFLPLEDP